MVRLTGSDGCLPVALTVRSLDFASLHPGYFALSPRDLIHLGVMFRHQIQEIVTAGTGFDAVKEVRRIDPMMFS